MARKSIEIGDVFGFWKVLKPRVGRQSRKSRCLCTGCNEVEKEIYSDQLRVGRSSSCGCKRTEKNRTTKDKNNQLLKIGDRFGYWKVLEKIGAQSLCRCTCGKEVEVLNNSLLKGLSKSCGCKRIELDKATKTYAHEEAGLVVGDVIKNWKAIEIDGVDISWLCVECKNETRVIRYSDVESGRRISCGCMRLRNLTPAQLKKKSTYYHRVQYLTKLAAEKKFTEISKGKHVDHIFSVSAGFRKGIEPQVIATPGNLQILDGSLNQQKNSDCWITQEELYKRYKDSLNEESKGGI